MHDHESSWQEDLRLEVLQEFLTRMVSAAEVEELELPHIVVCRDERTGVVSYSGPFRDGMDAMDFAEREAVSDRELNDGDPLTFSVAALYPAGRPGAG